MLILGGRSSARLLIVYGVLALSMLVGGLAAASAWRDLTSDAWHPDARNTYRITTSAGLDSSTPPSVRGPRSLADRLTGTVGAVKAATTVVVQSRMMRSADAADGRDVSIAFVDRNFPRLFDFGLNEAELRRMEAAGAVRFMDRATERELGVSGLDRITLDGTEHVLFPPLPKRPQSHFHADLIAPVSLLPPVEDQTLQTAPGRLLRLLNTHDGLTYVNIVGGREDDARAAVSAALLDAGGVPRVASLVPLTSLTRQRTSATVSNPASFVSGRDQEFYSALTIFFLSTLAAISSVMLLVRAMIERESQILGILRAMGRTPRMLTASLFGELAIISTAASLTAAVLAVVFGRPLLEYLFDSVSSIDLFLPFLLSVLLSQIFVCVLTCLFAWPLLSRPVTTLLSGAATGRSPRITLGLIAIGLQAALCFCAVFATLFTSHQLSRAVTTTQAFAQVWRVTVADPAEADDVLRRLQGSPVVEHAVVSGWAPYSALGHKGPVALEGTEAGDEVLTNFLVASESTLSVLPQALLAGDDLSSMKVGGCRVLANQTFLDRVDIESPTAAVGRVVEVSELGGGQSCVIAGVVADSRLATVRQPVPPTLQMVGQPSPDMIPPAGRSTFLPRFVLVKAHPAVTAGDLHARLGREGEAMMPVRIGDLERQAYAREIRLVNMLAFASTLVFVMICLTLASGVALILEERAQEVGVRRALGFGWISISYDLTKPFLVATGLGSLLGVPIALWFVMRWSQGLQQPVALSVSRLVLALAIIHAPLLIALAANWVRLRSISPSAVLRNA